MYPSRIIFVYLKCVELTLLAPLPAVLCSLYPLMSCVKPMDPNVACEWGRLLSGGCMSLQGADNGYLCSISEEVICSGRYSLYSCHPTEPDCCLDTPSMWIQEVFISRINTLSKKEYRILILLMDQIRTYIWSKSREYNIPILTMTEH